MGWVETRYSRGGSPRYVAKYRDIRGRRQTAGTFGTEKAATIAWQDAEAKVREGRGGILVRGRRKFEPYVRETWFPNHRLELRTRESYSYYLNKHIIPWFGPMTLIEILPSDIREFLVKLENKGVRPHSVRNCLTILSAIFTTALNDQLVYLHPCKGVRGPTVAKRVRQIMTPEQFDLLYEALPDEMWRLLVETDIESGLRWGELTELRPKDFNFGTHRVMVSRTAVELGAKFHPTGGRFLVKDYPKDREHRVVSVSAQLIVKVQLFIKSRGLGDDDLIFAMPPARAEAQAHGGTGSGHAGPHRAERARQDLQAWDDERVHSRSLQMRILPGVVPDLPGEAARGWQGSAARDTWHEHGRARFAELVPPVCAATRAGGGRARRRCEGS
ncbi:MAG TPA: site-specific integrase [Streptosporangiaceae bacterium]